MLQFLVSQFLGGGFLLYLVGSTEAPSKAFLLFFLFSNWLKWNRTCFFGHFSRHICNTVTKTIRVTNYAASFGAKKCSENQVRSC